MRFSQREVAVGQPVRVTVDAFPGESFDGTVERIADQAEFTPRNVQTAEGRKTTVFAVPWQQRLAKKRDAAQAIEPPGDRARHESKQ